MTIQNFRQLNAWKESHKLVILIYRLTDKFPSKENFTLISQLRRCVISISSNIAEGFSRQGKKEKIQFYFTSKGSLTELENQIIIAKEVGYTSENEYNRIINQIEIVGRLLTGLTKSLRNR